MAALMDRLNQHCNKERVTVFWSCGGRVLCTTGIIVEVYDDFVVVVGQTPTAADNRTCRCTDFATEKLPVVILARHICGLVFGVPECRKAVLPVCCQCPGSEEHGAPGGCHDCQGHGDAPWPPCGDRAG